MLCHVGMFVVYRVQCTIKALSICGTPRQVVQDREVVTSLQPAGECMVYTRESYMREHQGRDPEKDDNLRGEEMVLPGGQKSMTFKVSDLTL